MDNQQEDKKRDVQLFGVSRSIQLGLMPSDRGFTMTDMFNIKLVSHKGTEQTIERGENVPTLSRAVHPAHWRNLACHREYSSIDQ